MLFPQKVCDIFCDCTLVLLLTLGVWWNGWLKSKETRRAGNLPIHSFNKQKEPYTYIHRCCVDCEEACLKRRYLVTGLAEAAVITVFLYGGKKYSTTSKYAILWSLDWFTNFFFVVVKNITHGVMIHDAWIFYSFLIVSYFFIEQTPWKQLNNWAISDNTLIHCRRSK